MTRRNHLLGQHAMWLFISLALLLAACAPTHTVTVAAHPTATAQISPTATTASTPTPGPTGTPTPTLDPKYAYASFSTGFNGNELLDVSDVSTDGQRVYGVLFNPVDCQGPQSTEEVGVGWMDVSTHHVTPISLPGVSFKAGSFVTMMNAGQLVAVFDTVYGQSASSVTKFWIFNPATNGVAQAFAGKALTMLVSDNQMIVNDPVTGLAMANMQTQSVSPLVGTQLPNAGTLTPLAFNYPYLLYTILPHGQANATAHAYDLATAQDIVLPQLSQAIADDTNASLHTNFTADIANNAIYFADLNTQGSAETLAALTPIMTPPAQAITLTQSFPAYVGPGDLGVAGANARVILSGHGAFLWDLVMSKLFVAAGLGNAPGFDVAILAGKDLAVISTWRPADCTQTENVTLFDTSTLPTS